MQALLPSVSSDTRPAQAETAAPAPEPAPTEAPTPETEPLPEPGDELKGIIYIERPFRILRSSTGVSEIEYFDGITISTLDPDAGETRVVRSFPVDQYDTMYHG